LPITTSRLPAPLSRHLRRARRLALKRLPSPVKNRLRLAKWAILGPPAATTIAATRTQASVKPSLLAKPTKADVKDSAAESIFVGADCKPIPAPKGKSTIEVRREFIFKSTNPQGSVLEIGPAHHGTLPKRDGFNTKNVDHLDRLGLIDKYEGDTTVLSDQIEEVDYIIAAGATMAEIVSQEFDLVLASHVIEHTTSLIHFINACARLLTDDGALTLIVPDHRFCFDRFRERSSLSAVIDASLQPAESHSLGTVTEHALYAVSRRGAIVWPAGQGGNYRCVHDLGYARKLAEESANGHYIDVHHWVFTPNHLRLLIHDLADLGHISVREALFQNTVGFEFYLTLKVDGPGPRMRREELIALADTERRMLDIPTFGP
jgi:hypothetical protein